MGFPYVAYQETNTTQKSTTHMFILQGTSGIEHVNDVEGHCPRKELIKDIINILAPGNVMEAKAYLGMITYYWTFKPNLGSDLKPFCKVTENSL
jgi:hypothetical protein